MTSLVSWRINFSFLSCPMTIFVPSFVRSMSLKTVSPGLAILPTVDPLRSQILSILLSVLNTDLMMTK